MLSTLAQLEKCKDSVSVRDLTTSMAMLAGILGFAHQYANPMLSGVPVGIDIGWDLAYLGLLRHELLYSGRLLTWYSVAYDGMPLLGHPLNHIFYLPLILPSVALGTAAGVRIAYVISLVLAGLGMYFLARLLGARPAVAGWVGLLFSIGGTLSARLYAGHVEKVLAIPFIPWVLGSTLLVGRANTYGRVVVWAAAAGLLTGYTFLAGDSYLLLYLSVTVPVILSITATGEGDMRPRDRLLLGLTGWTAGLLMTIAPKMVATMELLPQCSRSVQPFEGSQDWYWSLVHLIYPFFKYGPTLPGQPLPDLPYHGNVPGAAGYAWWEYTQYVGIVPVILAALGSVVVLSARRSQALLSNICCPREVAALLVVCAVAALWLANASWYSPIHYLYIAMPALRQFRVPSRALMLTAPAILALAAVGLEVILRLTERRRRWILPLSIVAAAALTDVYLVTYWVPRVGEPAAASAVRRVIQVLQQRDSGPFLVDVDQFDFLDNSTIALVLSERGVRVANTLSPLVPLTQQQHNLIGPAARIRYTIVPASRQPRMPGAWEPLIEDSNVAVFVNAQAPGDAWVLFDEEIQPLSLISAEPARFVAQVTAPSGAMLVIPANAFRGWRVSIDGGIPRSASEFDGYVAVATEPGEHKYEVFYEDPLLSLILVLTVLHWGAIVFMCWIVQVSRSSVAERCKLG